MDTNTTPKIGFFEEAPHNKSMMRLMSFLVDNLNK